MALRRINPSKQPLLHLPRAFSSSSSSNPPFPPPPQPPSDDPSRFPPPNQGEAAQESPPPPPPARRIPTRPNGQAPAFLQDIKCFLQASSPQRSAFYKPRVLNASTPPPISGATPSFQDLPRKSTARAAGPNAKPFSFSFNSIRERLRKIDPQRFGSALREKGTKKAIYNANISGTPTPEYLSHPPQPQEDLLERVRQKYLPHLSRREDEVGASEAEEKMSENDSGSVASPKERRQVSSTLKQI